jgi:hypothetical protein
MIFGVHKYNWVIETKVVSKGNENSLGDPSERRSRFSRTSKTGD